MRYYQEALDTYRFYSKNYPRRVALKGGYGASYEDMPAHAKASTEYILALLEDLNTQRILFDARQAATFSELDELPPLDALAKVRSPFPVFYLEFTEPIMIGDVEPEDTHSHPDGSTVTSPERKDFVRAILFNADAVAVTGRHGAFTEPDAFTLSQVTFLLNNNEEGTVIDRTFKVHIATGQAYVMPNTASNSPDPSELPEIYLTPAAQKGLFPAGKTMLEDLSRHIGWWERVTQQYAEFLSWVLMYMMAKGISIVEQRLAKKERKQLQSKKAPVRPWHVIVVEPQISQSNGAGMHEGRQHSYRYDVMGHLRFGNHHAKDSEGNWIRRRTVEWIAPHQRGVQHSRYVPAVRQYKRGKATHPAFREYMEGGR